MKAFQAFLYGLSGATSLAYQIAWSRSFALAFGGTLLTTSAVVATFLLGLACGSALLGPVADRMRRPFLLYAAIEGAVALYAAASPTLIARVREIAVAHPLGAAQTVLLIATVLFPPTLLMGGTFPAVLAAQRTGAHSSPRAPALLYGANTFGAVGGVLVATFALLPILGLRGTVLVAAAVNLAVAATAAVIARPVATVPPQPAQAIRLSISPGRSRALTALALSGFAALLGEVAWTRALALVLGSSVYAFAIVLAAFLLGITIGSLAYARRPGPDPLADMAHYEARAATAAAVFALLLPAAPWFLIFVLRHGGPEPHAMLAGAFVLAFGITAYATTALGAAFPAGLSTFIGDEPVGRASGRAYAVNTAGSVLGALATAILFIPHLGLARTLALGVVCNIAAALAAAPPRPRHLALALTAAATAFVGLPWWWNFNQSLLTSGVYAYAYRYADQPHGVTNTPPSPTPEAPLTEPRPMPAPRPAPKELPFVPTPPPGPPGILFARDGNHANVSVYRDAQGVLSLLVDGKADASTALSGDMRTQLLLGYLPALLHRGPVESALVIGLGSGVTAAAVADYAQHSIDIVELEPVVAEVARRFFAEANRAVLDRSGVILSFGDGRSWVARSRDRYDMITSEPSNLWMSGVANLFTAEFFAEASRALRRGGVLCQWMHLYQVSPSDVRTVLRGLLLAFPNAAAFLDGPDLLVVASMTPLPSLGETPPPSRAAIELARVGLTGPGSLKQLYVGDGAALARFAGEGPLHTDDRPRLEFSAPRSLASDRSAEIIGLIRAAAAQTPAGNREETP